jgi:hypothetical protein
MREVKSYDKFINSESRINGSSNYKTTNKPELIVEVFKSNELFKELSSYWKALEKRDNGGMEPSYEGFYNWWKCNGDKANQSLFIITIWDGTKLVAVVPFYKESSTTGCLPQKTSLHIIGSNGNKEKVGNLIKTTPNIIVDGKYTPSIIECLTETLIAEIPGLDTITFYREGNNSLVVNYLYPKLCQQYPNIEIEQSFWWTNLKMKS